MAFVFEDFSSISLNDIKKYGNQFYTIRFSVSICLIFSMLFVILISLIMIYHEEKRKRIEFLIDNKINFDAKLLKDILSILVPRFIRKKMIQEGLKSHFLKNNYLYFLKKSIRVPKI